MADIDIWHTVRGRSLMHIKGRQFLRGFVLLITCTETLTAARERVTPIEDVCAQIRRDCAALSAASYCRSNRTRRYVVPALRRINCDDGRGGLEFGLDSGACWATSTNDMLTTNGFTRRVEA